MSAQHTPGPWKVCDWNGKSYTVYRMLMRAGAPLDIERLTNANGNTKRFRSSAAARAAIAKATGSAT